MRLPWWLAPWQPVLLAAFAKLAGQVTSASKGASLAMMHTLLNDIVLVLALTVITSILGALLVAAMFWGLYYALLWLGLSEWMALATTIGCAALVIIVLTALTIARLHDLKMPLNEKHHEDAAHPSLSDRVHTVANSFLAGFRRQRPIKPRFD